MLISPQYPQCPFFVFQHSPPTAVSFLTTKDPSRSSAPTKNLPKLPRGRQEHLPKLRLGAWLSMFSGKERLTMKWVWKPLHAAATYCPLLTHKTHRWRRKALRNPVTTFNQETLSSFLDAQHPVNTYLWSRETSFPQRTHWEMQAYKTKSKLPNTVADTQGPLSPDPCLCIRVTLAYPCPPLQQSPPLQWGWPTTPLPDRPLLLRSITLRVGLLVTRPCPAMTASLGRNRLRVTSFCNPSRAPNTEQVLNKGLLNKCWRIRSYDFMMSLFSGFSHVYHAKMLSNRQDRCCCLFMHAGCPCDS